MSEVQALSGELQHLGASVHSWSNWTLFFVVVTAFAAVGYGVTSFVLSKKQSRLATVQAALLKAKDDQLHNDLKTKDLRIAEAQEAAAQANNRAGTLEKEAAEERRIGEELKRQNLATEARLEEEKRTRLELEKSLTPHELPIISANGKQNIDPLKPFSGTKFAIECLDDIEPERAAGSLQYALEQAGWKPIGAKVLQRYAPVRDGVLVESRFWEHKNERAAKGLVKFLESINWVANWDFENPDNPKHKNDIPEDAVLIQVGFKPNPYFRPAEQKDLERMMKKRMEKMEEDFNKPE